MMAEEIGNLESLTERENLIQRTEKQDGSARSSSENVNPIAVYGVACSDIYDSGYRNQTYAETKPNIDNMIKSSKVLGEVKAMRGLVCSHWPIKAVDVFRGPFGSHTKNPILFVGNTYDPATPITNARQSSLMYPGSEVLTVDAIGHASLAARNKCAQKKMSAYLQEGVLPRGKDADCALEAGPFGILLNTTLSQFIS